MRPREPLRSGVTSPWLETPDWEQVSKLLSLSDEAARLALSRFRLSTELDKLGAVDLAGEGVRRCVEARSTPTLLARPSPGLAPYATARRCAELGRSEVVLRLGGMSSDASTGYGARRLGEGERPREGAGETPRTGDTPRLGPDLAGEIPRALVPVLAVLREGDGFLLAEPPAPDWLPVGLELERRRVGVDDGLPDEVGVAGLRDVRVAGLAPNGVTGRAGALFCRVGVDGRACRLGEALEVVGVDDLVGVAGRLLLACLAGSWLCDLVPAALGGPF